MVINPNKPLFTTEEIMKVTYENKNLISKFDKVKNIKEWNKIREEVKVEFKGTERDYVILFAYIDGNLHASMLYNMK